MQIKIHNLTWYVGLASNDKISVAEKSDKPNSSNNNYIASVPRKELGPCGLTFKSKLMIFINAELPTELFKRTIEHEITHAFCWSYGLSQFDSFTEEQLCDFMETHGRDIFRISDRVYKCLSKKNQIKFDSK